MPRRDAMTGWKLFLFTSLASLLGGFSLSCGANPTLPLYVRSLGVSESMVGLVGALMAGVALLIRVPAGALSTTVGRLWMILPGHAILAAAPLLPVLLPDSLAAAVALGVLYGFSALTMPSAIALAHDALPESEGPRGVAYYTAITHVGPMLGPLTAGVILDRGGGFEGAFALASVSGAVSFGLALFLRDPSPRSPAGALARAAADLVEAVADRRIRTASIARAVQTISQGVMSFLFPVYAKEVALLDSARIGLLGTAGSLAGIVSRPLVGWLAERAGRPWFMAAGMLASSLGIAILPALTSFPALLVLCVLLGATHATSQIATIAHIAHLAGKRLFGASMGLVGCFFELGLVSGRMATGLLISAWGYAVAFPATGGLILLLSVPTVLGLLGAPKPEAERSPVPRGNRCDA